jgi:hypothetical protein
MTGRRCRSNERSTNSRPRAEQALARGAHRADATPARSFAALSGRLVSLTRVVEALGGHVEVRAVFGDQTIMLLREPAPPAGA